MFKNFYKNKKVLVTGHTGFKGSWLIAWLKKLKTKRIIGISLKPHTNPSHYKCGEIDSGIKSYIVDLKNYLTIKKIILKEKPDFIFHLAANPLVKESYNNPIKTWETNLMGTIHVLEAAKFLKKKCVLVMITSDKSYQNNEWIWGYRENDRLGGNDPYSASKSASELAINSYVKSFYSSKKNKIHIAVARAGNVIGGGDWSNDRIVPDCIKAWSKNYPAIIRNPKSTRPWQHVIEPISGYLVLAKALYMNKKIHGEAFNFGPKINEDRTVHDLVKEASLNWNKAKWKFRKNKNSPHEAKLLKLNCDKAHQILKWSSILNFENTIKLTVQWYKNFYDKNKKINMKKITESQIDDYCRIAKTNKIEWSN
jgi:CDP-glucose 4,6-dehydratase